MALDSRGVSSLKSAFRKDSLSSKSSCCLWDYWEAVIWFAGSFSRSSMGSGSRTGICFVWWRSLSMRRNYFLKIWKKEKPDLIQVFLSFTFLLFFLQHLLGILVLLFLYRDDACIAQSVLEDLKGWWFR